MTRNKHGAKKLAEQRINYLEDVARDHAGEPISANAIKLARKIAQKHQINHNSLKQQTCLTCNQPLIWSQVRVRINRGRRVITCPNCNTIKRQ